MICTLTLFAFGENMFQEVFLEKLELNGLFPE